MSTECRMSDAYRGGHKKHAPAWENWPHGGHGPGDALLKILNQGLDLRKRAALGSRTPDLRITSTPDPASTVLYRSIRARQGVHHAQDRTRQNLIGGHEGGHARDQIAVVGCGTADDAIFARRYSKVNTTHRDALSPCSRS